MSQLDPVMVIALGDRCVLRTVLCARYMAEMVADKMTESTSVLNVLILEPE